MKILVVVDYQYDFFSPDGALYVNGGEKLQEKIANIIPNFDAVIFTQDWHPLEHCSFKENGGQWPTHCVAGTTGAGIPLELIKNSKSYLITTKGTNISEEEYGAFSDKIDFIAALDYLFEETLNLEEDWTTKSHYVLAKTDEIVICGLVDMYCVIETLKNVIKHIGVEHVSVFMDGIGSFDEHKNFKKYIIDNKIKIYK